MYCEIDVQLRLSVPRSLHDHPRRSPLHTHLQCQRSSNLKNRPFNTSRRTPLKRLGRSYTRGSDTHLPSYASASGACIIL
jgi:hypothetical protein